MSVLDPSHVARVLGGDLSGNNITAPGPNNVDRRGDRSMSVTIDPNAPDGFVVHSHSAKNTDLECKDYVRRMLGIPNYQPPAREPEKPKPPASVVCHYIYEDQHGEPYLRVTRKSDKTFAQSHWDIDGWRSGKPTGPVIPYRLPEILANADQVIHLVEGEKSADYLRSRGLLATTAPGGGSAFPTTPDFAVWFDGQRVRAYPDNDATGRKWSTRVSQAIPHAEIVHLPGRADKHGADDWLAQDGRTIDDLIAVPAGDYVHESETPVEPPDDTGTPSPVIVATPFQWVDALDIPQRPRLYGDHLFRKFVALLVSPGGLGKSSLITVEALAMASGRAILTDDRPRTPDPLRVWYWNGEDPQDETQRRVIAAAKHHGITADDIGGRLFTDTGREQSITLGQIARGEITLDEALFDALEAEILARQIDVFIIDPFVSSHRMGENDNNAIDAIVKRLNRLADRCNCAVEIVHHVRKPAGGSTAATDVNDARGASALLGAVRSARVLNVMSSDIAELAKIDEADRFSYFSVTNGKSNMTKRTGNLKWRHLHDFDLCNGLPGESDHVAVVEYFKLPDRADALNSLPDNAVMIAQRAAYDHPNETRLDVQSADWFGHLIGRIMGVDSVSDAGRATLTIAIETWVKTGALVVEIRPDGRRKPRQYLACPSSETPLPSNRYDPGDDPF